MIHEIKARRSTRRFIKKNIPEEALHALLEAASWAPSEHNEQPWRFVVVRGDARKEAVRALKEGIKRNRSDKAAIFGKGYEKYIPAAIYTARVLEQAPVIVFFINSKGKDYYGEFPIDEHLMEMADIQSVSAAIQNMCLEATARNIGTLWTCNIFFAYDELKKWLNVEGEMVAAIALGYTDREIQPLPRKPLSETVIYRGEYPAEE
ncbi:MAG: nitroreductase family protein [Dialister invisus]|uniref:nitroreductase family protein n=1 Tax=Dialister invisus TaxID=218538 RepID=UPI003991593E